MAPSATRSGEQAGPRPDAMSKQRDRRPDGEREQHYRGADEQGEPQQDSIDGRLDEAVDDAEADIGPRQSSRGPVALSGQGQSEGDRIEQRRLLHEMVVIIGLPARLRRKAIEKLGR